MSDEFNKYLDKQKKDEDKKGEKITKNRDKIKSQIFERKIDLLNNELEEKNIDFRFNIRRNGDHYEFDVPLKVLFGPKTQGFCADQWAAIMREADVKMDFSDEVKRVVSEMSGIVVTMKMNLEMTKEVGQGTIKGN